MKNCTISVDKEKGKPVNIHIEGELVLQNIAELKEKIAEAKKDAKKLCLEFNNIKNIDLSGIQLIYSLKKESQELCSTTLSVPEDLSVLIEKSGFKWILS